MINENDRWHLTMEVRNALADKFPGIATPYRVAKAAVDAMLSNLELLQRLADGEWYIEPSTRALPRKAKND